MQLSWPRTPTTLDLSSRGNSLLSTLFSRNFKLFHNCLNLTLSHALPSPIHASPAVAIASVTSIWYSRYYFKQTSPVRTQNWQHHRCSRSYYSSSRLSASLCYRQSGGGTIMRRSKLLKRRQASAWSATFTCSRTFEKMSAVVFIFSVPPYRLEVWCLECNHMHDKPAATYQPPYQNGLLLRVFWHLSSR